MLEVISLGAGVQSSTMALMAAKGDLTPMPDCAIFSDTGWEPPKVYDWLDWLEEQLPFPVHRVQAGNILDDILNGNQKNYTTIPFYLGKDGKRISMGRRQCTNQYKLIPIRKKIRQLMGLKKYQKAPKGINVRLWIGISTDEMLRMKPNRDIYIENIWPLIESDMSRDDCYDWMKVNDYGKPSKSSCIGCPFHSNSDWVEMKKNAPDEWDHAVKIDSIIRQPSKYNKNKDLLQYMHRRCLPLEEAVLLDEDPDDQLNLFNNECEGMCGV